MEQSDKKQFFLKLIPPRATFPFDMTADERAVMQQHVIYMREHFDAGRVLIYGPVLAAGAPFGMGVFCVDDEAQARSILDQDPSVRAGLNRYELSPMHLGGARGV